MITRDSIKKQVDRVQEKHLEVLHHIIKALETPSDSDRFSLDKSGQTLTWEQFIEATSGCLADDPIVRGDQGQFDISENIA